MRTFTEEQKYKDVKMVLQCLGLLLAAWFVVGSILLIAWYKFAVINRQGSKIEAKHGSGNSSCTNAAKTSEKVFTNSK